MAICEQISQSFVVRYEKSVSRKLYYSRYVTHGDYVGRRAGMGRTFETVCLLVSLFDCLFVC